MLASQNMASAAVCFYPVAIQPALKDYPIYSKVPLLVHLGADDALCKSRTAAGIKHSFLRRKRQCAFCNLFGSRGQVFSRELGSGRNSPANRS